MTIETTAVQIRVHNNYQQDTKSNPNVIWFKNPTTLWAQFR